MMKETMHIVPLAELDVFVKELLIQLPVTTDGATVLALHGDLGAGKTTFVKTLAKELGVTEEVTSPTFTIMQSYETTDERWKHVFHMDAYRIDELDELRPLGFDSLLKEKQTLFCIEWADKIQDMLPKDTVQLHFSTTANESERTIQIEMSV